MFKNLLTTATVIFSMVSVASAEVSYSMPSLELGMKMNTMDATNATSNKQKLAYQLGGSIVFNIGGDGAQFGLKTGLMYSERTFKNDTLLSSSEGKITYFDIPVHLMFKFEDYAGIYFGPSFSTKLGDECTSTTGSCSLTNVKSSIMPLTFGAQFKFAPNLGMNLFFETISGDIAQNLKDSRGVGASLLIAFD